LQKFSNELQREKVERVSLIETVSFCSVSIVVTVVRGLGGIDFWGDDDERSRK
jgi:hypothetical protein